MLALLWQIPTSKEAQHGIASPPPRQTISSLKPPTVVPLEQLFTRLPQVKRQELLRQLAQILAQRLAPPNKEEADE